MRITKGDKTIEIPNWALFIGALVLDNAVVNVCKTVSYKNYAKAVEKKKLVRRRGPRNGASLFVFDI